LSPAAVRFLKKRRKQERQVVKRWWHNVIGGYYLRPPETEKVGSAAREMLYRQLQAA
jgi:hypothetical protein